MTNILWYSLPISMTLRERWKPGAYFRIFREFSGLVLIRIGGAFRVTVLNWLDGELGSMGGIGNPPRCAGLRYAAAPLRRVGVLGWLRGLWLAG